MKNLLIIGMLLLCSLARGTTYYVATNQSGASDTNMGTESQPWKTVQKALTAMAAGDTTVVRQGDYSTAGVTTARTGSVNSPITLMAASGETATLGRVTIGTGHNYINICGFFITNFPSYPYPLIDVNGSNCQFLSNYIYSNDSADYGWSIAVKIEPGTSGCVFRDNTFDGKSSPTAVSPSIWICMNISGNNHVIAHNTVKNIIDCERVFEPYGNNITFSENEVYNLWFFDYNISHVDIFQVFGNLTANNIIIENNYFHDMDSQIGNMECDNPAVSGAWYVRNNVFANISSSMFIHIPNMCWYNNTFYNCAQNGNPISGSYSGADNMVVKNNIFVGCGQSQYGGWYNYQSGTGDYNFASELTYAAKSNEFSEPHGINGGNPQFVAAYTNCVTNMCDFHIKSTSVVKDKGTAIAGFTVDKDGVARPQGSSWDMGAYEYVNTQVRSSDFEVRSLTLAQPLWPNPITAALLIKYSIEMKELKIYNLAGCLVDGRLIRDNGIYLLQKGDETSLYKVTVIK